MAKALGLFLAVLLLGSAIFLECAQVPLAANFGLGLTVAGVICLTTAIVVSLDSWLD